VKDKEEPVLFAICFLGGFLTAVTVVAIVVARAQSVASRCFDEASIHSLDLNQAARCFQNR